MNEMKPLLHPHDALQIAQPVLEIVGATADPFTEQEAFMDQLYRANPRYRGEDEVPTVRYQLEDGSQGLSPELEAATVEASIAMGHRPENLDAPEPFKVQLRGAFDRVYALGGARMAVEDRTREAAQSMADGYVTASGITVVTSGRPIGDAEVTAVGLAAEDIPVPGAPTESDLGRKAIERVSREFPGLDISQVAVADLRADTAKTFAAALENDGIKPGRSVAAVTTQIYRNFQGYVAMRAADARGVRLEMGSNASDPTIVARRTAATYLSEVLGTTRGAVQLITSRMQ